jgi:hypothetical protein
VLCWSIALLVVVAAATALLWPGHGPPTAFVTARGEQALIQSSGVYRYQPAAVAREGLVWDAVNLVIGVPALLAATRLARRGSVRGRVAVAGLSLYFAYAYLTYVTVALNPLFLVYVAIVGLSLVNLGLQLADLDAAYLKEHVSARFPRRFFAGFAFALSFLLVALWGARLAPILRTGRFPPELAGLATLPTQALDLGVVVPLAVTSGVLLLRDHAWGYLLAGLTLTFGFMMCLTIPAWIAVPLILEGKIRIVEAAPFLIVCAAGVLLAALYFRAINDRAAAGA